jgi:restriction endonuclease S subunit
MHGSTIKHLTKKMFQNFKIPISINKDFVTNMNPLFKELEV